MFCAVHSFSLHFVSVWRERGNRVPYHLSYQCKRKGDSNVPLNLLPHFCSPALDHSFVSLPLLPHPLTPNPPPPPHFPGRKTSSTPPFISTTSPKHFLHPPTCVFHMATQQRPGDQVLGLRRPAREDQSISRFWIREGREDALFLAFASRFGCGVRDGTGCEVVAR